ncbi:MAG: hypothetical protein GC200_02165 [Tepidisphaera sp.]|nr:hypothetical protein [Tepidisphaera sp.]
MNAAAQTSTSDRPAGGATGASQPMPDAGASFEYCHRVVREHAKNFYYGLRLTPEPRRSAMYSVYAWMRLGDDIADTPNAGDDVVGEFQRFANVSRRVAEAPDDPQAVPQTDFWPAFAHTLATYQISPGWVEGMLRGLRQDLSHTGYETMDELDDYRHCVGGVVGLFSIAVWGLRPGEDRERALRLADTRGRAFQMVNILRDIGVDARMDPPRTYVPRQLLRAHGLAPAQLLAWTKGPACTALVRDLARTARSEFDASRGLESMVDPACAGVLWTMSEIYRGVLGLIESQPSRSVELKPASLSKARKITIALQSRLGRPWEQGE